jgi:hypothetical protein
LIQVSEQEVDIFNGFAMQYRVWFWLTQFLISFYALVLLWWQLKVLRGGRMENPDGSADTWAEQRSHFGMAVADVFFACPMSILAVVLSIVAPRVGLYLLGAVGFWFMWANIMGTATSLRFYSPKLTINWWITFPSGVAVGLSAFFIPIAAQIKEVN